MADRRLAVIAVGVALLTGCAGVPKSGAVHLGTSLPSVSGVDDRAIHAYPQGPVAGQSPVEVVTQYLDAMVDNDNNYGVARRFLAPDTSWNSTSRIVLYRRLSLKVSEVRKNRVRASFDQVGLIDARGSFRVAPRPRATQFRLVHTGDQWRISHVAPGVLLSTSDALRSLQPANLYFLTLAGNRLVPEPILVPPDQPGLATILVRALLAGPAPGLAPAVETAVPSGLDLVGNVPVDRDGNAEVNLSSGVQQLSALQLQRLSAQIGWTLRQIPTLSGVRLLENGTPLTDDGVPRVQSLGLWRAYDPNNSPLTQGALLVKSNGFIAGERHLVPKPLQQPSLLAPAFDATGTRVAAIRLGATGMSLMVGSAAGPMRTRVSAPVLSSPTFDPAGNVLVISGVGSTAQVLKVASTGPPRPVAILPTILHRGVNAIAVSRDGARAAMVVGPAGHAALMVGSLSVTRGETRITGVHTVVPANRDVAGVAWETTSRIATTVAHGKQTRLVLRTSVDGYRTHAVTSTGLPRRPTQVAAAPHQPLLATAAGAVWSLGLTGWARVSTGSDPAYAG